LAYSYFEVRVAVFPAEGREKLQVIWIERAGFRQHVCGAFEADGIPEYDGGV
jgi:hypothetical protein